MSNDRKTPDPGSLPFTILHLGADWLAIDKPAGLAVHPGPRTPHSLEDHLPALARLLGQRRPPVLMHRLDRDTSGCLLLARTVGGRRWLAQAFEARQVEKTYLAQLDALPEADAGEIDAPLAKISTVEAGWRMVVDTVRGKAARTRWRVLDRDTRLVAMMPATGRTHQLRVHATLIGGAIIGDSVYGRAAAGGLRLHARSLMVPQPSAPPVRIDAALPARWGLPEGLMSAWGLG
ncbi:RNA pseudouridine synthase [Polymorphobacter multimanifer]|uniref:tRNA pseudouridine32 synthase/23S rRNA pseudouridine746 synthase n=1 Tax=Polymorphobacter multimanifer TaxID=1070431 RepID=A0A841L3R8_9SPHN|nr:RNA pseudouridine synthase [Polymorphobacter multimanifer]MBB6227489.1 tRNA pseudouridine32 synthase/23S rRNA pseudouridine746 synthase [Polymorphobacter multimanifer]GGI68391.1 RNA pseudouridine synthase [Polymorphobacter multimanifer]